MLDQKSAFFPWLVVADTQVDGDKTDEVKVTEESIKVKNKNFVGLECSYSNRGVWFPEPQEGGWQGGWGGGQGKKSEGGE